MPNNYPNTKASVNIAKVDEEKKDLDAQLYYDAVSQNENDDLRLTSLRTVGVLAVKDTFEEAEMSCKESY